MLIFDLTEKMMLKIELLVLNIQLYILGILYTTLSRLRYSGANLWEEAADQVRFDLQMWPTNFDLI